MTLYQADLDLIQREPALPGLAWLLDANRFAELADQLVDPVAPGARILAAEPTYLRYKPGTSALASFRLRLADGRSQLVQAKALPVGRFGTVAARLANLASTTRSAPAPAAVAPLQLVLLRLEDDRKLRSLGTLLDPARRRALLGKLRATGLAPEADELTVLRYKPERRVVASLSQRGRPRALVRVLAHARFGQGLLGAALGAASCGAPLLAASARLQLLVTAWTPGRTLDSRHADATTLQRVGRQLAQLHQARALPPLHWSRRDAAEAVRRSLAMLVHVVPAFERRSQDLLLRVARLLESTAPQPTLIHGDFSADQVIDTGEQCRFIDWDRAAAGNAAADLGSFAARLELDVLQGRLSHHRAEQVLAALLLGYRELRPLGDSSIALQTAVALLQLAAESFRRRLPDWPEHEDALLVRAEHWMNQVQTPARPGRAPGACGPSATRSEPRSEPRSESRSESRSEPPSEPAAAPLPGPLARALDPSWITPALQRALGPAWQDARLAPPRLLRHKPGRRALIAYDIARDGGVETLIGKLRFRGLDRNGFEVQRALARRSPALLAPVSRTEPSGTALDAALVVPEVVGSLPEIGLWLQRELPGASCCPQLRRGADRQLAVRLADALACLHEMPVATLRRWSVADELRVLAERLANARRDRPDLAARIDAVLSACHHHGARLPSTPLTGVHRDFHPGQVLIDGERLVLLDFDLYAVGDPALDVGNFIAHLTELALRRYHLADALEPLQLAFLARYRRRRPMVSRAAIAGWTALGLARHIDLSLRYPERRATTEGVLRQTERLLSGLEARS